jgi:WD domain, G-beta repeat
LTLVVVAWPCVYYSMLSGEELAKHGQQTENTHNDTSLPVGALAQCDHVKQPRTTFISVIFLPDGQTLATTGPTGDLIFCNARTGKEIRRLKGHTSVAFASDGKSFASRGPKDSEIGVFDIETAKEIARVPRTPGTWRGCDLGFRFSPDGRFLAEGGSINPNEVPLLHLWEVATRKEVVPKVPIRTRLTSVVFSPDGKLLATVCELPDKPIYLWDVATGEERRQFPTRNQYEKFVAGSLAFSPDGNSLVAVGGLLYRWDLQTGKLQWRASMREMSDFQCLKFSPNGQSIAVGTEKGTVYLLEAATGRERGHFQGHRASAVSVSFSPDGLMLASAALDGSFLVWDVTGRIKGAGQRVEPLGEKELDAAWSDLGDDDAAKAWKAILSLTARPEQAVPLLKRRLPANQPFDPKRLAKLLADLDSNDFDTRDQASKDLAALGHAAAPALRKLLASEPSVDLRVQVEKLLGKVGKDGILTEEVRCLRALEILEYAATPEAKKLLAAEAEGATTSQLTQGAKAALERLAKQAQK